jgi:hypothetical protein
MVQQWWVCHANDLKVTYMRRFRRSSSGECSLNGSRSNNSTSAGHLSEGTPDNVEPHDREIMDQLLGEGSAATASGIVQQLDFQTEARSHSSVEDDSQSSSDRDQRPSGGPCPMHGDTREYSGRMTIEYYRKHMGEPTWPGVNESVKQVCYTEEHRWISSIVLVFMMALPPPYMSILPSSPSGSVAVSIF